MTFGRLGVMGSLGRLGGGGGLVARGPYPAPSGYRWAFVTENNQRVTENGAFVVALEAV